jgi:hypothetical protein
MTWIAPAWYAPPAAHDAAASELADRVEYGLIQQAQKVREPQEETWTLRIRQDQINAWLATRLRKWIEHEGGSWPARLGTPQVEIDGGALSIAVPVLHNSSPRFIVARILPEIENQRLQLKLDRVALGRISLPGEPVANLLKLIGDASPRDTPQIENILGALEQRDAIDPRFRLSDGRRIELLKLRLGDGLIDITAKTLERSE